MAIPSIQQTLQSKQAVVDTLTQKYRYRGCITTLALLTIGATAYLLLAHYNIDLAPQFKSTLILTSLTTLTTIVVSCTIFRLQFSEEKSKSLEKMDPKLIAQLDRESIDYLLENPSRLSQLNNLIFTQYTEADWMTLLEELRSTLTDDRVAIFEIMMRADIKAVRAAYTASVAKEHGSFPALYRVEMYSAFEKIGH